jgi:endoglucanase
MAKIDSAIRLSSIGYLPLAEKKASIAAPCTDFSVVDSTGKTAFSGKIAGFVDSKDTGEKIYIADFSTLNVPGVYYLEVKDLGRSFSFTISEDLYNEPYKAAMLGMYLWRCGTAVSATYHGNLYTHKACHLDDADADYIDPKGGTIDGTKGWHDAGDYNKYTVNAGATVGVMLEAWEQFKDQIKGIDLEVPEKSNNVPDYLDEIKWELDWLLKMQYPDGSGRISHKLSAKSFWGFILPEFDTQTRYFTPWSSAATADFVAMMAQASRIYNQYDPAFAATCLDAAKKSYTFLKNNPDDHPADLRGFATGEYQTKDQDDRIWAAAEMWETTGDALYLADFEKRAGAMVNTIQSDWDWGNISNLGMFTYLLSKREGKNAALAKSIQQDLIATADSIVAAKDGNAYARPLGIVYYWGCNGTVARQTMILHVADILNPKPQYKTAALDALNHLFGRNFYCRSYVTGLGYNPPMNPHDRRSIGDNVKDPWPGYLIGGGHSSKGWLDEWESYATNEIAINWNASLIYALAEFVKP